jgi:hypothetical protein
MRTATKIVYLVILLAITLIPLTVWANDPANVDLSEAGNFAAGLGVPLGAITAAMAAKSIQRGKDKANHEQ